MAGSRTIPESLHGRLCDLYGEIDPSTKKRRGYRELSAWLWSKHRIEASHEAVRIVVGPLRQERAEIRRNALRDALSAALPTQVAGLDKLIEKIKRDAENAKTTKARARAVNTYRAVVDTKLRYVGVGERIDHEHHHDSDVQVTVNDARAALSEGLAKLAPSADPSAADGADRDPSAGDG